MIRVVFWILTQKMLHPNFIVVVIGISDFFYLKKRFHNSLLFFGKTLYTIHQPDLKLCNEVDELDVKLFFGILQNFAGTLAPFTLTD